MNYTAIKNLLIMLLMSLLITACNVEKEKPQINPHPKHFLTLEGYISPALKGKIYLSFVQVYSTTSEKCFHTTNILAGLQEAPNKIDIYVPKPNSKGYYKLKIPLDRYLPGYCHWIPWALGYNTSKKSKPPTRGFSFVDYNNQQKQDKNPTYFNLFCKSNLNCTQKISKNSLLPIIVKTNESYHIKFNLLKGEQ